MKITRSDSEKLAIVDFPYVLGGFLFFLAFFMLSILLANLALGDATRNDAIGYLVAFGFFFICAGFVMKRSVFEFDLSRRQLTWNRTGMFGRKGGTVPFDQIKGVAVQVSSDSESLSYRVALTTISGSLPLSQNHDGRGEKGCKELCVTIRQALGLPALTEDQSNEADLRSLVDDGQMIEAIKLVQMQRSCSLAEAKQIVENMKK